MLQNDDYGKKNTTSACFFGVSVILMEKMRFFCCFFLLGDYIQGIEGGPLVNIISKQDVLIDLLKYYCGERVMFS